MSIEDRLKELERALERQVEDRARRGKIKLISGDVVEIKALPHSTLRELVKNLEKMPGADTPAAAALPWLKAELQERGDWS